MPFKKMNSSEMNLLMAICSKAKNKKSDIVTFTFSELRVLAQYKGTSNKQLIESLKKLNRKLMSLTMSLENEKEYTEFVLFITYNINYEKSLLQVCVHPDFAYLLNSLTGNFTEFELREFVALKGRYVKKCYLILKEFRFTGKWIVSVEDFRELLDIPDSYLTKDITRNIIEPVQMELKAVFHNLTVESIRDRHDKSHSIIRFEFFFDEEYYSPVLEK